jgi:phosphate butyryltransferase
MNFDFKTTIKHFNTKDVTIVVAGAADEVVFDAITQANKISKLKFILIGDETKIKSLLSKHPLEAKIINETDNEKIGQVAIKCIHDKQGNVIMKGLVDTKDVLKAVVNNTTGIKNQELLSHVTLMQYPSLHKSFIITDCAMNIQPNANDK